MRRSSMLLIAAALLMVAVPSEAKPKWLPNAKKAIPAASCTTCHAVAGKKDLNEVGTFAEGTMKNGEPDAKAVAAHLASLRHTAPEALAPGKIDARADLFSVGVLLQVPFGQSLVVATLAGVQDPGRGLDGR